MFSLKDKHKDQVIFEETITKVNGDVAVRRYSRKEFLGKGGFAHCYSAVNLDTNKVSAVKIVEKSSLTKNRAKQKLLSEIRIHKSLHHPNVVQFQNCFEDSKCVYILLELCPKKTLSEYLKKNQRLSVTETRKFMHQLLLAVKYIHSNRVIHRDLKLGNIFLGKNHEIKIGDFGLATKMEFSQERKRTMCGTPNYIAPEIIGGTVGHSYEVDAWSCGVICYALLFGKPPFETNEVKTTYNRIKSGRYQFPQSPLVPDQAKDFIKKTLQLDPKKRLTILEMLSHTFISKVELTKRVSSQICKEESKELTVDIRKSSQDLMGLIISPRNSRCMTRRISMVPNAGDVYLVKHVDYSSKYGMGYILSNGDYGVYFNDSSKLVLTPQTDDLVFISEKPEEQQNTLRTKSKNIPEGNKDLNKKFFLLEHFKYYIQAELKGRELPSVGNKDSGQNPFVYVKQWLKTKHAIMFRLSNKVFQVDFLDSTQLLLNAQTKMVAFTSKKGERSNMSLSQALASSIVELTRRIRYTKDILNSLKRSKKQQSSSFEII